MISHLFQRVHQTIVAVLPWLLGGMAVLGVIVVTTEQPGWQPELVGLDEDPGANSVTDNVTGQWLSPVSSSPESSVPEAPAEASMEALPIKAAGEGDAGIADTVDTDQGSDSASDTPGVAGEQTAVMTGDQPRETDTGRGPWVIYLASLRRKEGAVKFITMLQSRGVHATSHAVTVRGHEYWRVFVPGYATAAEANTEARHIKEKLDLDNVWVAKR